MLLLFRVLHDSSYHMLTPIRTMPHHLDGSVQFVRVGGIYRRFVTGLPDEILVLCCGMNVADSPNTHLLRKPNAISNLRKPNSISNLITTCFETCPYPHSIAHEYHHYIKACRSREKTSAAKMAIARVMVSSLWLEGGRYLPKVTSATRLWSSLRDQVVFCAPKLMVPLVQPPRRGS